jgi:sulfur carrier protein ThiS
LSISCREKIKKRKKNIFKTVQNLSCTMFRKKSNPRPVVVIADAIPVLEQPYPVPGVYFLSRKQRSNGQRQQQHISTAAATTSTGTISTTTTTAMDVDTSTSRGITFRTIEGNNNNSTSFVIIDDIDDPILLRQQRQQQQQQQQQQLVRHNIDQIVVSINGSIVRNSYHADCLLDNTNLNDNYTIISRDVVSAPFCKLIIGTNNANNNPGISFSSTRDETLVQVSRILSNGAFDTTSKQSTSSIRIGDIVLAVNGYPVSTTEQAYRALQLSKLTKDINTTQNNSTTNNIISIYAVDITQLRCSILREVKTIKQQHQSFSKVRLEAFPHSADDATFIVNDIDMANVKFDNKNQLLIDKEQYRHRFTSKNEGNSCFSFIKFCIISCLFVIWNISRISR